MRESDRRESLHWRAPAFIWIALVPVFVSSLAPTISPWSYGASALLFLLAHLFVLGPKHLLKSLLGTLPHLIALGLHARLAPELLDTHPRARIALLLALDSVTALGWWISGACRRSHPRVLWHEAYCFSARAFLLFALPYTLLILLLQEPPVPSPLATFTYVLLPTSLLLGVILVQMIGLSLRTQQDEPTEQEPKYKLIRIFVIKEQQVLMVPVDQEGSGDHPLYDIPLQERIPTGTDEQACATTLAAKHTKRRKPRYLLRHHYGSDHIYLYVLNVGSEPIDIRGEWIGCSQIARMLEERQVGDLFAEEFRYLQNTILLCNSILSQHRETMSEDLLDRPR